MSERLSQSPNPMLDAVQAIVDMSFSPELRRRQRLLSEFQPDLAPVKPGAVISLGTCVCRDEARSTFVDNVESIGHDVSIEVGCTIGPFTYVGPRVTVDGGTEIGAAARIEHGSQIGRHVSIEAGAILLTGCGIGDEAIIGVGAEVGYDTQVPPKQKVLAGTFA